MNRKVISGFTLIEMMIVVAILGIVAAIAFPSYTEYVIKGKRTDAKVELLKIAQLQESYFVQNLSYAANFGTEAGGLGLGATVKSEQEEYTITMTVTPDACTGLSGAGACSGFTLTADAGTGQERDTECVNFTLTNTGVKGVSAVTGTTDADIAQIKKCWK